jgi:diphthine-ammonia ligase
MTIIVSATDAPLERVIAALPVTPGDSSPAVPMPRSPERAAERGRHAISWSAGKDSWLALMRAREQGRAVETFVTMCDEDGTSKSHALPAALVEAQVRALGGAPLLVRVPAGEYAARFDACLRELVATGHTHMIFGDIDLQAHRDWLVPACERAGLAAVFPLWGESRASLAQELVARGVQARVVCVDKRHLDASFCGADYDAAFLARIPGAVCPCGEDGEFHTFVTGGPGFVAPLPVRDDGQRVVASRPPFTPTEFVFQTLLLDDAS